MSKHGSGMTTASMMMAQSIADEVSNLRGEIPQPLLITQITAREAWLLLRQGQFK